MLLLIIIPIIWYIFLQNKIQIHKNAKLFIPFEHLKTIQQKNYNLKFDFKTIYIFLIYTLLIVALATPISVKKNNLIEKEGYRIFLVIDTSMSMNALDFTENKNNFKTRLDVIKEVVTQFIRKKTNDLFALVTFGDYPVLQVPLTANNKVIENYLNNTEIGEFGSATAIGDALAIAVDSLKEYNESKAIILLTDGENNIGEYSPEAISNIAKQYDIPIFTIGIGSNGEVPILVENNVIYQYLPLDETTLKSISDITNAKYFKVKNKNEMQDVYKEISKLTKVKIKNFDNSEITHYYQIILLTCFVMILIGNILGLRRKLL